MSIQFSSKQRSLPHQYASTELPPVCPAVCPESLSNADTNKMQRKTL